MQTTPSRFARSLRAALAAAALSLPASAPAEVVSGMIEDWPESGDVLVLGDGVNNLPIWWSLAHYDTGYFYGRMGLSGNSEVAAATAVTDVSQITDASAFAFGAVTAILCDPTCDPDQVGDFVVWHSLDNDHYLALRIDEIRVESLVPTIAFLDATWWFQTDGTGNFAVPEAPRPALLAVALTALALRSLAAAYSSRLR
jgi:hypothetical protein